MTTQNEHRITIRIGDVPAFTLNVREDEESFYRHVIEKINSNINGLRFGKNADSPSVALAKVTLYYATMLYRQTNLINSQADLLKSFEERIDSLLQGTD